MFIEFVIIIIILLCFFILCYKTFRNESFYNNTVKDEIKVFPYKDTMVIKDKFKGTPIVEITALETRRFPFVVENVKNWYSTQPLIPSILGTDTGKECTGENIC